MDPIKCPHCAVLAPDDALLYDLNIIPGLWYTICQECGLRYVVPAPKVEGNPGRQAGGGRP